MHCWLTGLRRCRFIDAYVVIWCAFRQLPPLCRFIGFHCHCRQPFGFKMPAIERARLITPLRPIIWGCRLNYFCLHDYAGHYFATLMMSPSYAVQLSSLIAFYYMFSPLPLLTFSSFWCWSPRYFTYICSLLLLHATMKAISLMITPLLSQSRHWCRCWYYVYWWPHYADAVSLMLMPLLAAFIDMPRRCCQLIFAAARCRYFAIIFAIRLIVHMHWMEWQMPAILTPFQRCHRHYFRDIAAFRYAMPPFQNIATPSFTGCHYADLRPLRRHFSLYWSGRLHCRQLSYRATSRWWCHSLIFASRMSCHSLHYAIIAWYADIIWLR